jgi:pimeloyl-ACP methyl ester carboxylesterase
MSKIYKYMSAIALSVLIAACTHTAELQSGNPAVSTLTGTSADGVTFYGEYYQGGLDRSAPLILLFHQGGSNGRSEFEPLIPWLNDLGYRAIAWDQRTGGTIYGGENRTITGYPEPEALSLPENREAKYCGAYADFKGAMDLVLSEGLADKVFVWGGSYGGALAFQLASEYPENVTGLLAFSPSSSDWMASCRTRKWASAISMPAIVLRPESEMQRQQSIDQRAILENAGIEFHVVPNGTHASSTLIDERTEHDMSDTRAIVANWLLKTK